MNKLFSCVINEIEIIKQLLEVQFLECFKIILQAKIQFSIGCDFEKRFQLIVNYK